MSEEEINHNIAAQHLFGWSSKHYLLQRSKPQLFSTLDHYKPNLYCAVDLRKADIVYALKSIPSDCSIQHDSTLNLIAPRTAQDYKGPPLMDLVTDVEGERMHELALEDSKYQRICRLPSLARKAAADRTAENAINPPEVPPLARPKSVNEVNENVIDLTENTVDLPEVPPYVPPVVAMDFKSMLIYYLLSD